MMKAVASIVAAGLILIAFAGTTVGGCGQGIEEGGCFSDGDCEDCHRCAAGRCILVESLLNPCGECGPAPEEVCGDDVDNDCDTATDEADCVDPCEGIVCDHPPNECHQSTGTCRNRTCHYDFNDGVQCDDGDPCTTGDVCDHGACTGTQMTCDSPPPGECVDQNTWKEYGAFGSCVDGACDYPYEHITCELGCTNGFCHREPGGELWRFDSGSVRSSPAIGGDGTIYVGSDDHNLYAINPDGTPKWNYEAESGIDSSPAIGADGTVYVGSGVFEHNLYAIRPEDGSEKWRFETGGMVISSPAISADGTVYVGSEDYNLYAINPEDGSEKWRFPTGYLVRSSPSIGADGTVYVGSYDNNLYAVYPADGSEKWRFGCGGSVHSSPALGSDGSIYVGSPGDVFAVDPTDGSEKWRFSAVTNVRSSPAIGGDGTIYIGSDNHNLYALGPGDGSEKWRFETKGAVLSSPAIGSDGIVYVSSEDGKLYAIRPDGTESFSFDTAGALISSSPAIGSDGTVYFGSFGMMGGWLYAVVGSSPLADTAWPKFRANPMNTGRR